MDSSYTCWRLRPRRSLSLSLPFLPLLLFLIIIIAIFFVVVVGVATGISHTLFMNYDTLAKGTLEWVSRVY